MSVELYHHRSRKRFESWLTKNGITYQFNGYGCGMYDVHYELDRVPDWSTCPVEVWDSLGNQIK